MMHPRRPHRRHALPLGTATLVALLAGALAAQDTAIGVRAGEHPGYTRVVIDAPAGARFEWGVEGRRLVLGLPGNAATLDTAPAEAARGLSRIAGFSGGRLLEIAMSCDCGARVMQLADGRVVLDVSETAPRPAIPAALAQAEPAPPAAPEAASPAPALPPTPGPALVTPRPRPAPAQETPAPARESATALASPTPPVEALAALADAPPAPLPAAAQPEPGPDAAERPGEPPAAAEAAEAPADAQQTADSPEQAEPDAADPRVQAARDQLLRQLTRAAEEGFLTLAEPTALPAPEAGTAEAEPEESRAAAPEDSPIRARTAAEIAAETRPATTRPSSPDRPAHCLPDSHFAVAEWRSDAPIFLQMGAHRRALVGEFDNANSDAVLAYVRLLIAAGFGLEAQGALQAFADQLPPSGQLWEMARLVDGDSIDSDGEVALGLDCDGAHRVWAMAAAAIDGRLDPATIDPELIRDPISALPPRLRTRLVVPIATVALEGGRVTEAEHIAGLAARGEPPPPDGDGMLVVLLARIDAARGDWRRAEAALEPMLTQTSPASIEAMIRFVEMRVARRLSPPPGLAENMEAIAFTLGSDPLARRLMRAAATARAAGESLGLALSALQRLADRGQDGTSAAEAARDMLVDYAPDPAEGAAYAEAVLAHEGLIGEAPEADRARISIARNFMAIGLQNLAERILAPALARGEPAARLVAAEAAVADHNAERALQLLAGLQGDRAARLSAAAHAARGNYAAAAEAAGATGDAALEARYAWLAGNWEAAAAAGDADRRILAAWMAGNGEMPPALREAAANDPDLAATADAFTRPVAGEPSSLLDAAAEALENSRRRRARMGELLEDG